MDYFENTISTLLEFDGYWVRRSFKVNLTKEEKRNVDKPSIPRPEIDLLGLDFSNNKVIAVEAKSYLDSTGVKLTHLQKEYEVPEGKYKLFTSENYRSVVLQRLKQDLVEIGMANSKTKITLGFAVGKIYKKQSEPIRKLMEDKGWLFWSPEDIKEKIIALAEKGYENDPMMITAKILLR